MYILCVMQIVCAMKIVETMTVCGGPFKVVEISLMMKRMIKYDLKTEQIIVVVNF